MGNRRTHPVYRNGTRHPLPPPTRTRPTGPRLPGEPGALARAHHRRAVTMSDRLTDRLVSPPARASARKRANTDDETRRETRPRTVTEGGDRHSQGHQPPHRSGDLLEPNVRPERTDATSARGIPQAIRTRGRPRWDVAPGGTPPPRRARQACLHAPPRQEGRSRSQGAVMQQYMDNWCA